MNDIQIALNELTSLVTQFSLSMINELPRILGALIFLTVGWYLARIMGGATRRMLRTFNAFLYRRWHSRFGTHARLSPTVIGISGTIVRWTLVFFVLIGAVRVLEIETISAWLGHATDQIPSVIAGGVIVFVGFVLSKFVRDVVEISIRPSTGAQADVFGRLTQAMVIVTALVMGVGQAGIDTTLLISIVTILLAGLFGGMSIAFGLGAKDLVSNLIGNHHAQKFFSIGQIVRVGEFQGEIMRFTPSVIVISTPQGQVAIPGATFHREAIVIIDAVEAGDE